MVAHVGQPVNPRIGECFPTVSLVRAGTVGFHSEGAVEKQHTLPGPVAEVARSAHCHPQVVAEFLEDVYQRRRTFNALINREA